MSITDELREYANTRISPNKGMLTAIADRIDAEHEKECAKSWMRGHDVWASVGNDDKMAELGWMRLPKDADGELVHLGDVMEVESMTFRVASIDYGQHPDIGDGMFWMLWNADGSVFERADQCRHRTLLPCPFCGSTATMDVRLIEPPNWWSTCILCDGIYDHICSCQIIAQGDTEQEAVDNAIAAWNRRTQ